MGSKQGSLVELAQCLRQEKLYVSAEKKQLQQLNEAVSTAGRGLAQTCWVASQQRDNLEGLVMSRGDTSLQGCCQRANTLLQTQFTDAYKQLSHQMVSYSEFLSALRGNPRLLAECLAAGDRLQLSNMPEVVTVIFSSLLGCCILPEDERLIIAILDRLTDIQLIGSSNPRKLLRHGTSSFSRLYKAFTDQLFSAKIFLTSALYEPILALLTDDEIFLDIDPSKATMRFPPHERLKRFGTEDSPEHHIKLAAHRQQIILKLVAHANRFMLGIKESFHCFPTFLASLISNIASRTKAAGKEEKEVWAVCSDVLFNSFICPAIVDPEPKGIMDMPISYIARFNLMQIAQILQVLALSKWESVSQHQDLYSQLDSGLVTGVLETLMEEQGQASSGGSQENSTASTRLAVMLTGEQLQQLTEWLRAVRDKEKEAGLCSKDVGEVRGILQPLPPQVPGRRSRQQARQSALANNHLGEQGQGDQGEQGKAEELASRGKQALAKQLSQVSGRVQGQGQVRGQAKAFEQLSSEVAEKVLVVPIVDSPSELPGLAPEEEVLLKSREEGVHAVHSHHQSNCREVGEKRTRFSLSHDDGSIGNTSDNLEAISEAASNHSVASSLEDEVDPVEDPIIDNLSDMVSANVSGRGTPNVSGRDTPSSQVTEGDEPPRQAEVEGEQAIDQPINNLMGAEEGGAGNNDFVNVNGGRKNPEPDMEERFGRFDIKPEVRRGRIGQLTGAGAREGDRDEAVSMVSDTWSTDVLSSDTETVGEPPTLEDLLRGRPGDEFNSRHRLIEAQGAEGGGGQNVAGPSVAHLLDVVDAGSEAWSMDVLASDSESFRLRDFDLDDSVSVARSDDTRFTDDTARSDPEHINLQRLELGEFSVEGRVGQGERQKDHARHGFHPIKNAAVEQWAEMSRPVPGAKRRDSDGSGHLRQESILKKPIGTGPTLSVTQGDTRVCLDDSAVTDGPSDSMGADISGLSTPSVVRLSTTSIASSASSHGSNGSVDAVGAAKSRSNSSASAGTSAGGSIHGLVPDTPPVAMAPAGGPGASTGAIPKSISFDKSADKEEESPVHDVKHAGVAALGAKSRDRSFFGRIKLPKIGRRGGVARTSKSDEYHRSADRLMTNDAFNIPEHAEGPVLRRASSDETKPVESIAGESSDDILDKYRKKTPSSAISEVKQINGEHPEVEEGPLIDLGAENLETSFVFQDAKRKLRLVLSDSELPSAGQGPGVDSGSILSLLHVMLAQAINQQDSSTAAQLRETIRCISLFDADGCSKLVLSLLSDYRRRSPYLAYLVRARTGLLSSLAALESLATRVETEVRQAHTTLITTLVRLLLERREHELHRIQVQFSAATAMDDKTSVLVSGLERLWRGMDEEPVLAAASEEQRQEARRALERAVFSQVYMAALYPNAEGDASRDLVFSSHVGRLGEVVTPGHRDLKIPRRYQYECPWPAAQAELKRLAAYKLPADKVHCIGRVSSIIMNLLSIAQDKSVPAADDFLPVLVFVIIKANPPHLLSTVQFVDNFYRERLGGEESYWWMQFVGAVEFIKTMDYDQPRHNI